MASPTPEPSWAIREATKEDLPALFDVYSTVAEERIHIGAEPPIDRESRLERWAASFDEARNVWFVAVAEDHIVGNANLAWVGAGELGMAILPEWRGRGVGAALLEECIRWAEEHDIHKLELKVWPHNTAAIALYEKFGFEREGYLRRHYRRRNGEIWDCIIMGLQLPRVGQ